MEMKMNLVCVERTRRLFVHITFTAVPLIATRHRHIYSLNEKFYVTLPHDVLHNTACKLECEGGKVFSASRGALIRKEVHFCS